MKPILNSLAVKQLFHRPKRAAAAITGIAFSNILVLFQWGLLNALYKSQSEPYSHLNGELVILSRSYSNKSNPEFISKQAAQRAFANQNIESISFLNFTVLDALNPYNKLKRKALLYEIEPDIHQPLIHHPLLSTRVIFNLSARLSLIESQSLNLPNLCLKNSLKEQF